MSWDIIKLIRGDSHTRTFYIPTFDQSEGWYELKENDVVYFGITLPHQPFEHAIIKKRFVKADQKEDLHFRLYLTPEDTIDLLPGIYYYSIKVLRNAGTESELVDTIVSKHKVVVND